MAAESHPPQEEEEIQERTAPPGEVVYEAIYREGQHEMERDSRSLALSGLAAGLSMGFSFVSEALLRVHLPEARWQPMIAKLGYSTGFLIVILGRQQLFTKNTLTVMLPLFKLRQPALLKNVSRLWVIVLLTNLAGAAVFGWLLANTGVFEPDVRAIFARIGSEAMAQSFGETLLRSIFAGWLIALMIWLLPFAESARIWVIVILAYFIGLGHFAHIVAGTVPTFYLVCTGAITFGGFLSGFVGPVLLGNVIGGVALVAAGAHAEFVFETPGKHRPPARKEGPAQGTPGKSDRS